MHLINLMFWSLVFILLICAYWQAGGFDSNGRRRQRLANRRNARSLELLKKRGQAWDAWDAECQRDPESPELRKLWRAYVRARKQYDRFPIDWYPLENHAETA
jgi:hypothetical protein